MARASTKHEILAAIRRRVEAGERFPTLRVLADEIGSTKQTVGSLVNRMIAGGEIAPGVVGSRRPQGSEAAAIEDVRPTGDHWREAAEWEWLVTSVANRYRRRRSDVAEMEQVARLALVRAIQLRGDRPEKPYYIVCMKGAIKSYLRDEQAVRSHRRAAIPTVEPLADEPIAGGEPFGAVSGKEEMEHVAARVREVIATLDPRLRRVVEMRMDGATLADVGGAVGRQKSTVLAWERDAHARLRAMLADCDD